MQENVKDPHGILVGSSPIFDYLSCLTTTKITTTTTIIIIIIIIIIVSWS
jgi:hypothetical protein